MNTLLEKKQLYFNLKEQVKKKDRSLFNYINIDNFDIDDKTLSIVMTSSNRSKQTYYTLKTISQSSYKNIQIILVDDSTYDPLDINELLKFPFNIDLIKINRTAKYWHNPLVNYNIGFTFVKGYYVIIQNAEVCHVGDVINHIINNIQDNLYFVYDVKALKSIETNEKIYELNELDTSIYANEDLYLLWYQHKTYNRQFHFLTGMTRNTFNLIDGFCYDYSFSSCYDDDDFVLKIHSKNIQIINIFNEDHNLGGIHLYHINAISSWDNQKEMNVQLFRNKLRLFQQIGKYIDITKDINSFDEEYNKLLS